MTAAPWQLVKSFTRLPSLGQCHQFRRLCGAIDGSPMEESKASSNTIFQCACSSSRDKFERDDMYLYVLLLWHRDGDTLGVQHSRHLMPTSFSLRA